MIILSYKEYKPIIIIGLLLTLLIASIYVISLYWPKYEEYFFELALLGEGGMAEKYFPNDYSSVDLSTPMSWHVYLHNHMGAHEEVVVRIKILNSTMLAPDDREHVPSPEHPVMSIPVSLSVDETVLAPFSWSVLDAEYQNGTILKELVLNDESVKVNIKSLDDRFRVVLELWVYDQETGDYLFGWYSKGEFYSASIYMWFQYNLS